MLNGYVWEGSENPCDQYCTKPQIAYRRKKRTDLKSIILFCVLPEAELNFSHDHHHPFRYYYWMWSKTSQTEPVSVRYTWNLGRFYSDRGYRLCCHCNRHECLVVNSLSWALTLSGCCKIFSFSVSCIIYCEVHPIHLQNWQLHWNRCGLIAFSSPVFLLKP